ncbi:anhydro-N-acetylmuramic acid kinase [Tenericutes bacterium MZ-XQ]|nr:anhydro-N-acetylmuramic acid kinase [Tenericutes bacterium MZ-XQ]
MSGTSLDGIDVVLTEISGVSLDTKVKVIYENTYPLSEDVISQIHQAMDEKLSSSKLISSLNVELGYVFGQAVLDFAKDYQIDLNNIDFIASHGQTIYHIAKDEKGAYRSSLQLGEAAIIADMTSTTVVYNFRNADIASGGQGAPLVPYADYILFTDKIINRSIHNIGGIANMTYLKKNGTLDDVIAFDSGPGNMMINEACQVLYNLEYDKDGIIASKGKLIEKMYDEIYRHPYFNQIYPKSTGREIFGSEYTLKMIKKYKAYPKEDIIQTLSMITVDSIVDSYHKLIQAPVDELVLCGGGAYNHFIRNEIAKKMPDTKVIMLEDLGYSSSYKEALAFVILANQTLHKLPSNVKSATGAKTYKILGQIQYV